MPQAEAALDTGQIISQGKVMRPNYKKTVKNATNRWNSRQLLQEMKCFQSLEQFFQSKLPKTIFSEQTAKHKYK